MGNTRPIRSDGELKTAAGHLRYEIKCMLFAARYIDDGYASPVSPPEGQTLHVFLEAFLLHFRNLRDFLCPNLTKRAPFDDDVLASDFLDSEKPLDLGSATVLGKDQTRINKMLAHISYERERYKRRGDDRWLVQTMCGQMVEELKKFLEELSKTAPDRREWFPSSESLRCPSEFGSGEVGYTSTTTTVRTQSVVIGGSILPPEE